MGLRDYQQRAVEGAFAAFERCDFVLAVLATGCGKTVIFSAIVDRFLRENPGRRVMVLAHREELIYQAADKIARFTGRNVAIEMGERKASNWFGRLAEDIVISTIQTQLAGGNGGRMTKFDPAEFGLIVVDEAHHAVSKSYVEVLKHYRQNKACKVLGVTATPDRADERAMGRVFQEVCADYDAGDAIRDGWLTGIRQQLVTVTDLDFSAVRTTAGDLNGADLAKVMEEEHNLYGVADATRQLVGARKTLIFAASVKQSQLLCDILNRYEPDCARAVDGKLDRQERRSTVERFARGDFQFLVNCAVFTEGFDVPDVAAVVMARPTKSRALYAQMLGRGTRPVSEAAIAISTEGLTAAQRRAIIAQSAKPDCLVIDFAGNSGRHKLITSVDILGACGANAVEDEVLEIAKARLTKASAEGRAMLTEEAIEEAKAEAKKRKEREAARRARVKAKAKYTAVAVDPFDVFGIQRGQERGWERAKTISDKQAATLEGFGVPNPRALSFHDARRLLDECFARARDGRPSFKQERLLKRAGITYPVRTKEEATRLIGRFIQSKQRGTHYGKRANA